jgi:hypothetical protein
MAEPTIDSSDVKYGVVETAARLREPLLRHLHDVWQAASAADRLPDHDLVDPRRLGEIWESIIVLDVLPDDVRRRRYRYRRIGAEIVARRGHDRSGGWLDEHEEPTFSRLGPKVCDFALEARRAVYVDLRRRIGSGYYALELLVLPLADPAGEVDCLLVGQIYPPDAPRQGSATPPRG